MKKIFYRFLLFIIVSSGVVSHSFAAERYNLVLFYADWNVYSDRAAEVLESAANKSKNISFEKINIDDKKAFVRMKQLGVMPTNKLPYYFLIDKHKKIIYGSSYDNEPEGIISETLQHRIED